MTTDLQKFFKIGLGLSMLTLANGVQADEVFDDLNQHEIVAKMGAGWNLGNTLEANSNGSPSETVWGNPETTPQLIRLIKQSGFNTIRIPVSYLNKIGGAPNYKIDENWLKRVKEVVDYAIAEDMFVITNIHGDGYKSVTGAWLLCDSQNQNEICAKYKAVWEQIANVFKDYDEHLIFESMNEEFDGTYEWQNQGQTYPNPTYYNNINKYNQIFVETVRQTSLNNAKRWLLIPGWNTDVDLTSEEKGFVIPNDTYLDRSVNGKRLMISVHYYNPWDLCGDDTDENVTRWGEEEWKKNPKKCTTYGEGSNRETTMSGQFSKLKNRFVSKGYPVVMGEYGIVDKSAYDPENTKTAAYWVGSFCTYARQAEVVPVLWDNGHLSTAKGFATIDRRNNRVARTYIVEAINNAFDQVIEIDTTAPNYESENIKSYVVDITIKGMKNGLVFKSQYTGWDWIEQKIGQDGNYTIDLSPKGVKEGFTNLGTFDYTDSVFTVKVNKITVNGYEFTSKIFTPELQSLLWKNGLPNLWSNQFGEYDSDDKKAFLKIDAGSITLNIRNSEEQTYDIPVDMNTVALVPTDGGLEVRNAEGMALQVYTIKGNLIASKTIKSDSEILTLEPGIYALVIDGRAYKVVVK